MQERGAAVPMPPNPAPHLTKWLMEIGPSVPGGFGEVPITWRDIAAWQDVIGIELEPWEARLLRELSIEYVSQRVDARKPDCPMPWLGTEQDIASNRDKVAAQARALFGKKS